MKKFNIFIFTDSYDPKKLYLIIMLFLHKWSVLLCKIKIYVSNKFGENINNAKFL